MGVFFSIDLVLFKGVRWLNSNFSFWNAITDKSKLWPRSASQVEVLSATGLLTNLTKFIVLRQRHYSYFNSKPSEGKDDYLSFFSGHASISFSMSISFALFLQDKYPHTSGFIWSGLLSLSAFISYLRIAAEKHYMSDVLTGATIGSVLGYFITKENKKHFFKEEENSSSVLFYISFPVF